MGLILSIDGRPEVHDRMRPDLGGSGSHSRVLAKIKEAVAKKADDNWSMGARTPAGTWISPRT